MNRKITLLSVLLAAQLVLAGLVWSHQAAGPVVSNAPLLAQVDSADAITVVDPEDGTLVLKRQGDGWQFTLSKAGNTNTGDKAAASDDQAAAKATADTQASGEPQPAAKDRVEKLIGELAALKKTFPVAKTDDARERFKVARDDFKRKIVLAKGDDTLATLYLGTSPSMGESNVRVGGDNAIYRGKLAAYQVQVTEDAWKQPPPPKPKPAKKDQPDTAGSQNATASADDAATAPAGDGGHATTATE